MLRLTAALLLTAGLAVPAVARNVDLSTVPDRATVQLTIYNSEDLTLVRETRTVSFKKGVNPLQFSWANTLIDPSSVQLRFLTRADQLEVLDTTFPLDKPQMLYWNVQSEFEGEATVEITYFTSGIRWTADYVAIADADEKQMRLESFVRVTNASGEDYEHAQVRLVVGTINLVEKIAQLAQVRMEEVAKLEDGRKRELRYDAARKSMAMPAAAAEAGADKPKEIVKEGLSEYFIYTIEGTETIPTGWSKRLRSFEASAVPIKIQYRYRPAEYGDQLVRMYLLRNDVPSKLGTTPLPDGVVRVFRETGRDSLRYVVSQAIKYIPIGDKIELNLGPDPEVLFELVAQRSWRDNIWMHVHGGDVLRRVDDGNLRIDVNCSVAGWDEHTQFVQRIRNYSPRAIEVEVRRSYDGHVEFKSPLRPKAYDYRTPEFTVAVPAGTKKDFPFELVVHQGRNAQQNNVTLSDVE